MAGSLLEKARRDKSKILSRGGFEDNITIQPLDASFPALELKGLVSNHWFSLDTDGMPINAKSVHISIDEKTLIDSGYPYLKNGKVFLYRHKVTITHSSGVIKQYLVNETNPNETLGIIVCILGDYVSN